MAAFSYQPHTHPFLLDSIFFPNVTVSNSPTTPNSTKVSVSAASGFMDETANGFNSNFHCFPQFQELDSDSTLHPAKFHESSCVDHSSMLVAHSDNDNENEPSVTKKQSTDDSTVVDKLESGEQVTQNVTLTDHRKRKTSRNGNSAQSKVRREKISERMKVTGKALMLDEIINYVQSLQNQVEFLSMKLASVNPMFYDFGVDLEALMVRPDQDNGSLLWDVEDQRQKFLNSSGLNDNLCSFH
ncbi:hypothetical protein COLO4_16699 [Corchorus olitorius]|uniref:BHLH domain-containing protein n=1 Tax=Corchorus olitorius TaxID=93759 RepID=A0A1R3JFZ0_9ROSI|nr:hypothetical protein COLO4_16699 [Corchorus olitorius]